MHPPKTMKALLRKPSRSMAAKLAAERWWDRQEQVTASVPPELSALWDRLKGRYCGGSADDQLEEFLQYAHDHPAEVIAAQVEATDAKLETMIRSHEETLEGSDCPF